MNLPSHGFSSSAVQDPFDPFIWFTGNPLDLAQAARDDVKMVIHNRHLPRLVRRAALDFNWAVNTRPEFHFLKNDNVDLHQDDGLRLIARDALLFASILRSLYGPNTEIKGGFRRGSVQEKGPYHIDYKPAMTQTRLRILCALTVAGMDYVAGDVYGAQSAGEVKISNNRNMIFADETVAPIILQRRRIRVGSVAAFKAMTSENKDAGKLLFHRSPYIRNALTRQAYVLDPVF